MSRLRGGAAAIAALLLVFVASTAYRRVFAVSDVLPVSALSAAVPFLVVSTVSRRASRAAALLAGLASTALVAVIVAGLLATPPLGSAAPRAVMSAVLSGWSRILTTTLPAAPTADRLTVVALTTGVAACVAAILVRTQRAEWAAYPALGLFAAAMLLGVGGAGSATALALPMAGGVLLLLLASALQRRTSSGSRSSLPAPSRLAALTALVVGTLAISAGAVLGPATPGRAEPVDLRAVVVPPVAVDAAADPLSLLSYRLTTLADTTLFTAEITDTVFEARLPWRLATFDSYDGIGWSTEGRATSVGLTLASGDATEEVHIEVGRLDGIFVPTVGEPLGVSPPDLQFDAAAQTLIDSGSVRTGAQYELAVNVPVLDIAQINAAPLPANVEPALMSTSCIPQALTDIARDVASIARTPAQQAAALARTLSALPGLSSSPEAQPGSGCGRIGALLTSTDQRGTSEQFATAFTLAARSMGLPTRLAVGFRPGVRQADGRVVVTGADAFAWPEVLLGGGIGWVPFDPTPKTVGDDRPDQEAPALESVPAPRTVARPAPTASTPPPVEGLPQGSSDSTALYVALGAAGAGLAVIVVVATVVLMKARRRRLRASRSSPDARLLGAWQEVLEVLAGQGRLRGSDTATDVAEEVVRGGAAVAGPATELSALVNRAVYDPRPTLAAEADVAWAAAAEIRRVVLGGMSWPARVRHTVDPRGLRQARSPVGRRR